MIKEHQEVIPYTLSIKVDGYSDVNIQLEKLPDRKWEDTIIPKIIECFNTSETNLLSMGLQDSNGNVIATYYSAK